MKQMGLILIAGTAFGYGLGVSQLFNQEVVLSFLYLDDLGLMLTMAAAIAVAMPVYQLAARRKTEPVMGGKFEQFPKDTSKHHIVGGMIFGIGWGLAGVCPGAALASLGAGNWPMFAGFAGMLIGAYAQGAVADVAPRPAPEG